MIDLAWQQQEPPDEDGNETDVEQRDTDEQEARRIFDEECDLIRCGDTP